MGELTFSALHVLLALAAGCNSNDLESICVGIGACDPPQPPPVVVTLLCDFSRGASCVRGTLDTLVVEIFDHLKDRPGSQLDVWTLGQTVGESRSVAQIDVTPSPRSGLRAEKAHQKVQPEEALKVIRQATESYFASAQVSRSHLIETLAKISLSKSNRPDPWVLIVISDALEYSRLGDWECLAPEDTAQLATSIEALGILTSDSFQDAAVTFAWVTLGEIDGSRCPLAIQSSRRVTQAWSALLAGSGASSVRFESGPPNLYALLEDEAAAKKGDGP